MKKLVFTSCIMKSIIFLIFLFNFNCAQSPQKISNIQIEFKNNGTYTDFTLTSSLNGDLVDMWIGVGLNQAGQMNGASVVICKNSANFQTIEHNYNQGYTSNNLENTNPSLGLSNIAIDMVNGNLKCSFRRENSDKNKNYFDLNGNLNPYLIAAYGALQTNGDIRKHSSQGISSESINFNVLSEPISTSNILTNSTTTSISTTNFSNTETTTSLLSTNNLISSPSATTTLKPATPQITSVTTIQISDESSTISLIKPNETTLISSTWQTSISKTSSQVTNEGSSLEEHKINKFNLNIYESPDSIYFIFLTEITVTNNIWSGFAFSTDMSMGNDDLCLCKITENTQTVEHYLNNVYTTPTLLDSNTPSLGFSNIKVSLNNGILNCSFTRVRKMPSVNNFLDLTGQYYILFATGPIKTDQIQIHTDKVVYNTSILLSNTIQTTQTTYSTTPTLLTTKNESNGVFSSASFTLQWTSFDTEIIFLFKFVPKFRKKRLLVDSLYSAVAFSTDDKMGDDDVYLCKSPKNSIERYYNNGKSPSKSSNPLAGISDVLVRYENGVLSCSFKRAKRLLNVDNYYDLTNPAYILIAQGELSGDEPLKHVSKAATRSAINFQNEIITIDDESKSLLKPKIHASIMIIGWMFIGLTGIILARYYKFILSSFFPKDSQLWFLIHKPIMIFVAIASVVGFLIILSDLDWKWVETSEPINFAHSITGILTIFFAIIQILVAFCRPDPEHTFRFIFRYFHRTLGITAFLLAVTTLFLGVFISRVKLGNIGWPLLVAWSSWIIILVILIELGEFILGIGYDDPFDEQILERIGDNLFTLDIYKTVLLFFHLLITFGLTLGLVIIIGTISD